MNWRTIRAFLGGLPLGTQLYFFFWTLFVPVGLILLFAGAVVPGLALLVLFIIDQAVVTPLLVARAQRAKGRNG